MNAITLAIVLKHSTQMESFYVIEYLRSLICETKIFRELECKAITKGVPGGGKYSVPVLMFKTRNPH